MLDVNQRRGIKRTVREWGKIMNKEKILFRFLGEEIIVVVNGVESIRARIGTAFYKRICDIILSQEE